MLTWNTHTLVLTYNLFNSMFVTNGTKLRHGLKTLKFEIALNTSSQSKHQLPAVVVALLLPTSSQIPLCSIWTSGKFSEKLSICWGVEQHVGTWWAFHSWKTTCLQKGNRPVPCFMVKEGVGSSKKPTTFAGVPAATVLHDWTHPRHLKDQSSTTKSDEENGKLGYT